MACDPIDPPSRLVVLRYNPNRLSQLQTPAAASAATAATTTTAAQVTSNPTTNNNITNGASSPAAASTPARTSTPTLQQQPPASASRAPSAVPTDRAAMPAEAAENGAPTRVYLNTKVTSHVLDGMKVVAKDK